MKVKKTLTIDPSVLDRVQKYADEMGVSLSSAFAILACMYLDGIEATKSVSDLKSLIEKAMKTSGTESK